MFRAQKRSRLLMLFSVIALIATSVPSLSVWAQNEKGAMKDKLKAYLNAFEFKEGFQQMVNNPHTAREVVREQISQWPDNVTIIRCLVVLERVGERDDALRVLPFLRSEDSQVRLKAIRVMTALGDDRILAAVEMCLYDTNDAVRSCAIAYFEKQPTKSARDVLGRFLEFEPKTDNARKDQERITAALKLKE